MASETEIIRQMHKIFQSPHHDILIAELVTAAHTRGKTDGTAEENAKWEQWTGCSRLPQIDCKHFLISDPHIHKGGAA